MFDSKRYCNFVKQSKAIITLFIFALFIFNSCSDELITIVDEYNPPYEVKAIPNNDGTVSINFWSGVLADDFAGFNLYAKQGDANLTEALVGLDGNYPTVKVDTHTRSNFTLSFSDYTSFQFTPNGSTLYYVAVTAYGTNDLADGGKIETKFNAIPVVPREETTGTVTTTDITAGTLKAGINNGAITLSGYKIQSCGVKTNFNEVTRFTNDNAFDSVPYMVGGLYIFSNGTSLTKVWITSDSACTYATHSEAASCPTI